MTKKPPTAKERSRMDSLRALGCVACWLNRTKESMVPAYTEIHHLNVGGFAGMPRRGHAYTIPLCTWHHRGVTPDPENMGSEEATKVYGPSLYHNKRDFKERYGTDSTLLTFVEYRINHGD